MSGFFRLFDHTKPGPGVPKDAPPKPGLIVFFEIFFRKFWHLVKLNMLFFLFNLPAFILLPFIVQIYFPSLNNNSELLEWNPYALVTYLLLGSIFIFIPVLTVGPAQSGFTYVLRNFAREQHAFLWSDFKEHALKNLRQSTIICLIDLVVIVIAGVDLNFYFRVSKSSLLLSIITGVTLLVLLIYIMMHLYIYPQLVTFELSIKQIYKNAFIFAIIKFFPNLLIIALCSALVVLPLLLSAVGIPLVFLITMSTIGLIINFYVYPVLKKYIINKVQDSSSE
jgi:uncharacterized membrane protein YesL